MTNNRRNLVLIHGLWDSPSLFNRFINLLDNDRYRILRPSLIHRFGKIPLITLAKRLDKEINEEFGSDSEIDILGFSMGGIVARIWIQQMGGSDRTGSFLSVGSPHLGTYTAQIVPKIFFEGIADMKVGSELLNDLNVNLTELKKVSCSSYFCKLDLLVFPGSNAILPVGSSYEIPVLSHKDLILNSKSLNFLKRKLS